jgi:hypothetical protein
MRADFGFFHSIQSIIIQRIRRILNSLFGSKVEQRLIAIMKSLL